MQDGPATASAGPGRRAVSRAGREQPALTTSEVSGRSHRTTHPHHRWSEASAWHGTGEHFGCGDHFAGLRPICSHLQGQAIQRLLTAATCAHSPARQHRAMSNISQKRRALCGKQDAAPTLTCGNENVQVGVGAVGHRSRPLDAVQRHSVHPSAPIPLPHSRYYTASG